MKCLCLNWKHLEGISGVLNNHSIIVKGFFLSTTSLNIFNYFCDYLSFFQYILYRKGKVGKERERDQKVRVEEKDVEEKRGTRSTEMYRGRGID